jgi:hypothetical protein
VSQGMPDDLGCSGAGSGVGTVGLLHQHTTR